MVSTRSLALAAQPAAEADLGWPPSAGKEHAQIRESRRGVDSKRFPLSSPVMRRTTGRRRTHFMVGTMLVLLTSLTGVAYAALPQSGNGTTGVGGGVAYQAMSWNYAGRSVTITSRTAGGMSTDRCIDAIFDWRTSGPHFDGRKARNCQAGTAITGLVNESNFASVVGPRISGGCYYNQANSPATFFGCESVPGSILPYPSPVPWTAMSHYVFLRAESGAFETNSGGDPTRACC